uniref:Zinc finger Ran-binding domain-containing protein 2 n=1 Tax=Evadne anonyx TaxID=141404 RepID=A0A9N6ZF88_9CRUS|nr:EOG090X0ECZ [Evadne anonyx]
MSGKFRPSDGDWTCPDSSCGNINFARRDACNRCGKAKEEDQNKVKKLGVEIGKDAAEKSKGLFSADDWMCTKCANVNWARRSTCNVCNAPKFGDVEERTGYGGGYNERGNVEYVDRVESDDEFDEYGRKKKKYRKDPSDSNHKVSKASSASKKSDSEDEEEDDDDGDLSKYDLSGWGDEEVCNTNDKKNEAPSKSSSENAAPSGVNHASKSSSSSHSRSSSSSRSRSR